MNIKIYSTPTCPYCVKVKEYLDGKGIVYENFDVSRDRIKADEMVMKSSQRGVPVLDIDGVIVIGFDRPRIDSILGLQSY